MPGGDIKFIKRVSQFYAISHLPIYAEFGPFGQSF